MALSFSFAFIMAVVIAIIMTVPDDDLPVIIIFILHIPNLVVVEIPVGIVPVYYYFIA